jgi:hypothetical protein
LAFVNNGLCVLEDSDRKHLRRLVDKHGLAETTRLLKISRGVVMAAVAGIGVRRGSLELVRDALAAQRGAPVAGGAK